MDRETIFKICVTHLVKEFELPEQIITPEAHLFNDLKIDSIDMLELIIHMEDDYELEIVEEEIKKVRTIGEFIDYVLLYTKDGLKANA